jgi:hypothetical protein
MDFCKMELNDGKQRQGGLSMVEQVVEQYWRSKLFHSQNMQ